MSAFALHLIEENKQNRARFLDLGNSYLSICLAYEARSPYGMTKICCRVSNGIPQSNKNWKQRILCYSVFNIK